MHMTFDPRLTHMVGRTWAGTPVWRSGDGKTFSLTSDGVIKKIRWKFRWPKKWGYARLPAPHLDYLQVSVAAAKSRVLLSALKSGPLKVKKGFIYNRSNQLIMAKATAGVVLHWLQGCGIVLLHTEGENGVVTLDLDVEATRKNNVSGI